MLPSDIEALYASRNGRDIDRSAFLGFKGDRQTFYAIFIETGGGSE